MDTFKTKVGGVEREIMVREPKHQEVKEANKVRAKAYFKAMKDGLPLAKEAMELMQKASWDIKKSEELNALRSELIQNEEILTKKRNLKLGGPGEKSEETMFRVAMKCMDIRSKILNLNTTFAEAQQNTVEGYAENERLNYILYATTVYKDSGERVFSSYEDFDTSTVLTDETTEKYLVATLAFRAYQNKVVGDYQKIMESNPENAFFKRFKFVNEEGQFINKEGKPINSNGEPLDKNGDVIPEKPPVIDKPIPFLDNEGNPILDKEYEEELAKYEAALAKEKATLPKPEEL